MKTLKTDTFTKQQITLEPDNARNLANLCGERDANLREIEERLDISIHNRGNIFQLEGNEISVRAATELLANLYAESTSGIALTPEIIHLSLQSSSVENLHEDKADDNIASISSVRTPKVFIKPRGKNQKLYVQAVRSNDINFGIGPAGTGKTYLAVACAVEALEKEEIQRILLVRPAVEAGEKLGFLPGDLSQKVDPYLRPLYDALYEMIGFERVEKLIERHVIEIAPLAFMRGRTLNNSFIILDESQNTTREQMKMFLTRIGYGSTAVITGDITQVDLAGGAMKSGLKHALEVLANVPGISFTHFTSKDVVRHPLVQRIVEAYSAAEENHKH